MPARRQFRRECLIAVATLGCCLSGASEIRGQGSVATSALQKAFAQIDWKKQIQGIPTDPAFQNSVRDVFPALKSEAQARVTLSMRELSLGRGPLITQTPVDVIVVKHIAEKLRPIVLDDSARHELGILESSGDLASMLKILSGDQASIPQSTSTGATPEGSLLKRLAKTQWTWGPSREGALSKLTFGAGKTLQINNDQPHRWQQVEKLTLKWDDGSLMIFSEDLSTFEVETASGKRFGRLLGR